MASAAPANPRDLAALANMRRRTATSAGVEMMRRTKRAASGSRSLARRGCAALAIAGALAGMTTWAAAQSDGTPMTATGEVVDLACYMSRGDKGRGPAHRECAEMCAKGGAPLGLLGADGTVVLLVEDHAKPAPYAAAKKLAGSQAEVQGTRFVRGGVTALMVSAAKEP
jgi:hypothetical protein